ncbi:MAG: diaminopimelate epimerase [Candidatus Omnitrophica bacterium]|nr:diaminopimelate epimerase [Candidatus Omnitrophota bacterium]
MKKIPFFKYEAAGNDFILIDRRDRKLPPNLAGCARSVCDRTRGIGADGLLAVERSRKADIRMRIFNADGSEAEMCGNGIRCVGVWAAGPGKTAKRSTVAVETLAGVLVLTVAQDTVKVRMSDPVDIREHIVIPVDGKRQPACFINIGVPHTVLFTKKLAAEDIDGGGRAIRYHTLFQPQGTNVNFVQVDSKNTIRIRTYERGVEAETCACGTGAVASAIMAALTNRLNRKKSYAVSVKTRGGDSLKVLFRRNGNSISQVYLAGAARLICKGTFFLGV